MEHTYNKGTLGYIHLVGGIIHSSRINPPQGRAFHVERVSLCEDKCRICHSAGRELLLGKVNRDGSFDQVTSMHCVYNVDGRSFWEEIPDKVEEQNDGQ